MSYTINKWSKGDVVTSAKLNHIEEGIASAGVLVVDLVMVDGVVRLGETWQTIYDNGPCFVRCTYGEVTAWGFVKLAAENGDAYTVEVLFGGGVDEIETFSTEDPNGYPIDPTAEPLPGSDDGGGGK